MALEIRAVRRSKRIVAVPLLVVVLFLAYWGYRYSTHSTPQRALVSVNSSVRPFEIVKFAKGVVLLTPSVQSNSFTAWYMTKNFWGWHVSEVSHTVYGLSPQNYNVDFESFVADGQTFIWGTNMTSIKEIVYRHKGETYTCQVGQYPVWHMIVPFPVSYFPYSEWTMILPNGNTAPLFK